MQKIYELNSLIHGQYPNQASFASAIGWRRQRLNKIVNGEKQPSIEEVQTIAEGLGVPFMMVCKFFLKPLSPNE